MGLGREMVGRIARGEARPELYARIQAAVQAFTEEARRLGAAWARHMMSRHIKEGLEGKGETARKCREYVLNQVLGEPGHPITLINQYAYHRPDLTDLSPGTKMLVLKELGGPLYDEDEDE